MRIKRIPNTELSPSVLCLGTSHFGDTVDRDTSFELMDRFLEQGGSFLDTAKVYGDWVPGERSLSEKTIGQWLTSRKARSRVVLATKGAHPHLKTMQVPRLNREDIIADVEESLRHLQTDYIDLYWLHRDDRERSVEDIMETMNDLVRQGKIRCFGCSNWRSDRIEAAQQAAMRHGLQGFAASQIKWSLASYPAGNDPTMVAMDEKELLYHERSDLPAVPYNSQAAGFFSGRYRSADLLQAGADAVKTHKLASAANIGKLKLVEETALRLSLTMTQVALGYLLSREFPVFPIIGCKTAEQLASSCAAGALDDTVLAELRNIRFHP
ncbi:General stress protein 69 [Paenibacillus konkukensis]|uniref:General stress protein 69 n=1 Tax=Paenibacillus konkukensis TaxID=2020716 RepID=A0ABY4RFR9_9BACL|nr:aldo/keto reductase [Paenibacillus konkukensis]UQZ81152.1 General stress protein 69 [Paenibacillus konkukensis]